MRMCLSVPLPKPNLDNQNFQWEIFKIFAIWVALTFRRHISGDHYWIQAPLSKKFACNKLNLLSRASEKNHAIAILTQLLRCTSFKEGIRKSLQNKALSLARLC